MSKLRILVVEDERLIARDIAMQLRDFGYEPLGPAHTGEQAIEMAEELRPDLVLMDVHLGSAMDGIEAAQAIRAQFDVPTVFLSAFSGDANGTRAQLAKPAGYLAKPFEDYELREIIEAAFKDG
jgi:CheY-like chemotaxis protein